MVTQQDRPQARGFDLDSPQFRVAAARRMLFRNGLDSECGGHVSIRTDSGDAFWTNPVQYGDETLPEHIIQMGFDLEVREAGTFSSRSNAGYFHRNFYVARPDVNCVIHTHGRYMSLLSTTGVPFDAYYMYGGAFLDQVGVFEDEPSKPLVEGDAMTRALGDKRVLLMAYHGSVHVGRTLEEAVVDAIHFELCCERQVIAMGIGGKPMNTEVAATYGEALRKGPWMQDYWDAQLRRLPNSDPDLFEQRA